MMPSVTSAGGRALRRTVAERILVMLFCGLPLKVRNLCSPLPFASRT